MSIIEYTEMNPYDMSTTIKIAQSKPKNKYRLSFHVRKKV